MLYLKLKKIPSPLFSKTEGMAHQEKVRLINGINMWKKKKTSGKSKVSRSQSKGDPMIFSIGTLEKLVYKIIDPEISYFNECVFIKK